MSIFVILTGTDPSSRKGGIGSAMPGYLRALDSAGISWYSIPTYHPSELNGKWKPWLKAFPKLAKEITAAQRQNKTVLVYSHAGAGVSLLREFFILLFARACGAITLVQLHSSEINDYLHSPINKFLFRIIISPAHKLAVLTPWWRQLIRDHGIRKPVAIVPNPLPAEWEMQARRPLSHKGNIDSVLLLSLTRLVPGKGVDAVIEAMPFLPDRFQLVIAGDGPQRPTLQQRTEELNLTDRVHFAGWVSGDKKQQLFDDADIFVHPSRYDALSMGFLEAMANGLPVVATQWGPTPDAVPDGRCGVLAKEGDPQALAKAILSLQETQFRQHMGNEAKHWVLERFSAKVVGMKLAAVLQDVKT